MDPVTPCTCITADGDPDDAEYVEQCIQRARAALGETSDVDE